MMGDEAAEAPERLKGLQERLGQIHDAHAVAAWFGRQAFTTENRHQEKLAAEARRIEARFVAASRHHHQDFLNDNPLGALKRTLELMGQRPSAA